MFSLLAFEKEMKIILFLMQCSLKQTFKTFKKSVSMTKYRKEDTNI